MADKKIVRSECSEKDNSSVVYIYTTYITRNGKRIYAKEYGLKPFRIAVPAENA